MLTYIVYYLYVCNSKSKVRSFCIGCLVKKILMFYGKDLNF